MLTWPAMICALALGAPGETVLLDFSATWCGPCQQMEPTIRQLIAAGLPVRKIDIDQQPELAQRFKVDGVPCFVMLVDGREVAREVGATSRARLEQMLQLARAPASEHGTIGASQTFAASNEAERSRLIPKQISVPKQISEPFNRMAQGLRDVVSTPKPQHYVDPQVIERVMSASVRIRIAAGDGNSTGSGTIIDSRAGEALIVTCGHIFRESKGQGQVNIELFGANGRRTIAGRVVSYDLSSDIGLVSMHVGSSVMTAPLAPIGAQLRKSETVVSVGCSNGDDPSARVSHIASLDKFLGPSNIQVAGQPVQGRSGGGLFTDRGELIGVCNAADPTDDEGLYAALKVIHGEIARMGLDQLIARPAELAVAPPRMPSQMPANSTLAENQNARAIGQSPDPQSPATIDAMQVTLSASEVAMLNEVRQKADTAEVICIIRSQHDPRAKSEVVVLDRATPEFLAQLAATQQASIQQRQANLPVTTTESKGSSIPQVRTASASTNRLSWFPKWGLK